MAFDICYKIQLNGDFTGGNIPGQRGRQNVLVP